MNQDMQPEETSLEELANMPLSELVEPQDLELPYDYIEDLMQRGVIEEDRSTIDIDSRFLDGPEPEHSAFEQPSIGPETPLTDDDFDFGR